MVGALDCERKQGHGWAMNESVILTGVATAIGMLVALGLHAAMLIIAATIVRKHRPDCWIWFAVDAGTNLFWAISGQVLRMASSWVVAGRGAEQYMQVNAAIGLLGTMIGGAAGLAILMGVMKLARPAPVSQE